MKYLIPLILILTVVSCKHKTKEQIKKLDHLLMELNQLNDTISAIDTSLYFTLSRSIKVNLKAIHENADTLSVDAASLVAISYEKRFSIFYLEDNYQTFLNELETSSKQLIKLKQDLENGLLSKETFNIYYEQEKTIIVNLNEKINEAVAEANDGLNSIRPMATKIDSLINYIDQTTITD